MNTLTASEARANLYRLIDQPIIPPDLNKKPRGLVTSTLEAMGHGLIRVRVGAARTPLFLSSGQQLEKQAATTSQKFWLRRKANPSVAGWCNDCQPRSAASELRTASGRGGVLAW